MKGQWPQWHGKQQTAFYSWTSTHCMTSRCKNWRLFQHCDWLHDSAQSFPWSHWCSWEGTEESLGWGCRYCMIDSMIKITDYSDIHSDIVQLLESSRRAAAKSVQAIIELPQNYRSFWQLNLGKWLQNVENFPIWMTIIQRISHGYFICFTH